MRESMHPLYRLTVVLSGLLVILAAGAAAEGRDIPRETHSPRVGLANPAAVYCRDMGYEYQTVTTPQGQTGICQLPNGKACDQWDFLAAKCGANYSFCAKHGYNVKTLNDGKNPFSREYAVCTSQTGQPVGSVSALSHLPEKASGCFPGPCPQVDPGPMHSPAAVPQSGATQALGLALPAEFSWRTYQGEDWLSPVKNQGWCGSCWAFAAVGAAEAAHNISAANPDLDLDLSEQYLVSDCFPPWGCGGGPGNMALFHIRDQGIPDEACVPYEGRDTLCSLCSDASSRLTTIDEADYLPSYDPQVIKEYLFLGGPLVTYMGINPDFGGYFDADGIYRCTDDSSINHVVVIAGYNDVDGYWIVKNSWGNTWGEDGYFKVGYGECRIDDFMLLYARNESPARLTLNPVADSQVKSAYPNSNYGALDNLRVRHTSTEDIQSYLKFDVSELSGPVLRAVLRLYVYDGSDSGGSVYMAGNEWTEFGINWNNRPTLQGSQLSSAGAVSTNTWVEHNVTDAITGNGTYTFALTGSSSNSVLVTSKEAAANPPELVIYTRTSTPEPPILLQPEDGAALNNPSVTLTWQNPGTPGLTGYNLRVSTSPDPAQAPWIVDVWLDGSSTSYLQSFASDGQYYWHMQSTTSAGNSQWITRSLLVDTLPPSSIMNELPTVTGLTTFIVSWGSSDMLSGVASYDVQFQDDGGAWTDWHKNTTEFEAEFTGGVGHTYGFRVRARDRAGNVEAWPDFAMAETTIVTPPPNDDYANAVVIDSLPFSHTQVVTGATPSADDPFPSCGPDDLTTSVWFRYTATQNGTVRFDTTGSDFNIVFVVVTGTPGHWVSLECADNRDGEPQPVIDVPVTAGTTYHIVVSGWYWADYGTLIFSATDLGTPPAVFEFAPTDDVQVKSDYPTRNYNSLAQLRVRAPSSDIDSYLKFNVTGLSGPIQRATLRLYSTDGSPDGGTLYLTVNVYSGSELPWTETGLTWNNTPAWMVSRPLGSAGLVNSGTWVEWDVTSAVTNNAIYSFALTSSSTNSAVYDSREAAHPPVLVIESGSGPLPPENDNFLDVRIYAFDQTFTDSQDTTWATAETADPVPSCSSGTTKTVWYALYPFTGGMVRFDTIGSDFETVVSVWTGPRESLVELGCSDSSRYSPLDVMLTTGTSYYIMIAGGSGSGGHLTFNANVIDLCASVTQIPQAECEALVAVYNSTDGQTWTNHTGWMQSNTPCDWYGVGCYDNRWVESLWLDNNNLTGSIPPQLGNLVSALTVNLAHNHLTGAIPPELSNLNVEDLWLQFNELEGSIPPELASMHPNYFNLSHNHLTGTIPPEFGSMSAWEIDLSSNHLEGPIPPELGQMGYIEGLYLQNNRLSGEVPATLANLGSAGLYSLDVGYNLLTASDPAVVTFLNTLDPGWATTQTTAPANVVATALSESSIAVSWIPIPYASDGGYYEVGYSLTGGGPYVSGCTTPDKIGSGCAVNGLSPQTTYYLAVRTFTPLHGDQPNDLVSAWSQEASATTLGGPLVLRFTPVHDAQVKSSYPASNYGALNNLRVRYTSTEDIDSYLKFDVNGLSGPVQRATLRLYAYDGSDSGGAAYAVGNTYRDSTTPWIESGIKWTNAPAIVGSPLSTAGRIDANRWVEYDVTAAIAASGTYSFAISGTSTNSVLFYSKEAAQSWPELVIELGPGAAIKPPAEPPTAPTTEPTAEPTVEITLEPPIEPTTAVPATEPAITPESGLLIIESDDAHVQLGGNWSTHDADEASGGRYLYSSGSPDDSLMLSFTGSRVEVILVQHPTLGSFTVAIDGVVVQTVNSTASDAVFGARIALSLSAGPHTLRIVPVSGVIAIDAFAVEAVSEPPAPPTQEPMDEPLTPGLTVEPPPFTPLPADEGSATAEPPGGPTPDAPADFGRG